MGLSFFGAMAFGLHALIMGVDEFLHHQRGLSRWERLGHPLDTLTVLACVLYVISVSFNPTTRAVYLVLAIFSTVFITKDEWIHAERCPPLEHWLHSLLFILHPVLLGVIYFFWKEQVFPNWFVIIPYAIALLGLYQFIYWNLLRKKP